MHGSPDNMGKFLISWPFTLMLNSNNNNTIKLMALVPHPQLHEFEWNLQIYPNHKLADRRTWLDTALYHYPK